METLDSFSIVRERCGSDTQFIAYLSRRVNELVQEVVKSEQYILSHSVKHIASNFDSIPGIGLPSISSLVLGERSPTLTVKRCLIVDLKEGDLTPEGTIAFFDRITKAAERLAASKEQRLADALLVAPLGERCANVTDDDFPNAVVYVENWPLTVTWMASEKVAGVFAMFDDPDVLIRFKLSERGVAVRKELVPNG